MMRETDSAEDSDLDFCDGAGNVIARFADGHIKTKNFDSSNTSEVDVISKNGDINDGVYASCRYHQPTLTSKNFCFLAAGDIHADKVRMDSIIKYVNGIDAFDCGVLLGDIVATNWKSDASFYTESISAAKKPWLTVIGNHDAGSTTSPETSYTDVADLYNKFIAPNIQYAQLASGEHVSGDTYYYKDFSANGIRMIVLNQYEFPSDVDASGNFIYRHGFPLYSQEQINWFVNTLKNTPAGYAVIICIHSLPARLVIDHSSPWTSSSNYDAYNTLNPESYVNGYIIPDIVDAWISGTTLVQEYPLTVTGTWTSLSVNADFTTRGTGEFVCYIGGHWHMSLYGTCHEHTNQHILCADCASLTASTQGDTPRKEGTRSEDCFWAVSVDRTNKAVNLVRIGAHFTHKMTDRLIYRFNY